MSLSRGPELNATTFGSAPGSQLTANTKAAHRSLPNAFTAKKRGHEEVEEDDKVASEIRPAKTLKSTETVSHHADASAGDNGDASMTNDVLIKTLFEGIDKASLDRWADFQVSADGERLLDEFDQLSEVFNEYEPIYIGVSEASSSIDSQSTRGRDATAHFGGEVETASPLCLSMNGKRKFRDGTI